MYWQSKAACGGNDYSEEDGTQQGPCYNPSQCRRIYFQEKQVPILEVLEDFQDIHTCLSVRASSVLTKQQMIETSYSPAMTRLAGF